MTAISKADDKTIRGTAGIADITVAILALQGAFAEHGASLDQLGVRHFEIRQKKDLEKPFDALIIPGGESTVMAKLLRESELLEPIRKRIQTGMPVFGTCAGLILLAKNVEGEKSCLGTMDIRVKRNAYGRQLGSFYTEKEFGGIGVVPMTFIRAPYIAEVFGEAEVLAEVDGRIVAARQNHQLVTAFHPELNDNLKIHQYFLEMIL